MSKTISDAASGCPIIWEFLLIWTILSSSSNHDATLAAISVGFLQKSPKPDSKTTSTLPASCPGRKLVSITGNPTAAASDIVPGPAFVTRTSAATM
eukprot:CAMPEP_0116826158 /NCGR_PEP_ID=MMETSP0418-20121206/2373_1 /TAXON_ID=1158023 /ORGANISM="Astrosyne radiata, Strain 13vi08-1A" /LENGTH=95 /DNA_ID=CAMNT_0004454761 /DNA_START=172 /DNA_END=459 /DNA_ORIENTATION=+